MHLPFPAFAALSLVMGLGVIYYATLFGEGFGPPPKLQHRLPAHTASASLASSPLSSTVRVVAPIACGPVWCDGTRRWRDPVSKRFVKTPSHMEASAQ